MTTTKPRQELLDKFRREVSERAGLLDPDNELYWMEITLGWAVAQGLDVDPEYSEDTAADNAHNFAIYVRYDTDLA